MSPTYPTDMTDEQWAVLEPHIPGTHGGHPRVVSMRAVLNAISYRNRAGCQWRMLPKEYPPWQTVYYYFSKWRGEMVFDDINDALRERVRVEAKREPTPSAAGIDSQTVKTAPESGQPCGFDQARKITGNGRERHIAVDSMGLLLLATVTSAATPDAVAARELVDGLGQSASPACGR